MVAVVIPAEGNKKEGRKGNPEQVDGQNSWQNVQVLAQETGEDNESGSPEKQTTESGQRKRKAEGPAGVLPAQAHSRMDTWVGDETFSMQMDELFDDTPFWS